ncbi:MAG: hypothetical protein OXD49_19780 [Candidatus Poribacteria bacterium]|nr:hypothetical protein [Candidatus Poribacteria bacterium]
MCNKCDPIVDKIRKIREAHAAKFNYDPRAIYNDFKEQERHDERIYVSDTLQDREFRSNIRIQTTNRQSGENKK